MTDHFKWAESHEVQLLLEGLHSTYASHLSSSVVFYYRPVPQNAPPNTQRSPQSWSGV